MPRFRRNLRHPTSVIDIIAGQEAGDDLARVGTESEMKLPPGPPGPAMLLFLPLALAEQLQMP